MNMCIIEDKLNSWNKSMDQCENILNNRNK